MQDAWFGLEFNLMVISGQKPLIDGEVMEQDRGRFSAKSIELKDDAKEASLLIQSGSAWDVCIVPIECISQSEEGFEKTFQGWSIYWMRKLEDRIPDITVEVR
jgi:hypothetical protein